MASGRSLRSVLSVVAAAVVTLLAAGGGPSVATAAAPTRPAVHPVASTVPTEAGNRRLARQEAIRLVAAARVPAHAVRARRPPSGLAGPFSQSEVTSLFIRSRCWTVRLPFTGAVRTVRAHLPAGLVASSSGTASGPHLKVTEFTYAPAVAPTWGSVEYEIALSRLTAGVTGIRVDAVATWLDPRPIRDNQSGPRLRVTVAAACPAEDRRVVGVRSPGPFLDGQLVYRAHPTAARVCSYAGSNDAHPFTLTRSQLLTPARARAVAAAASAVSFAHTDGAVINCPLDTGRAIVIALTYPGRPDVDLWYKTTGCPTLANGHVSTLAFDAGPGLTTLSH